MATKLTNNGVEKDGLITVLCPITNSAATTNAKLVEDGVVKIVNNETLGNVYYSIGTGAADDHTILNANGVEKFIKGGDKLNSIFY